MNRSCIKLLIITSFIIIINNQALLASLTSLPIINRASKNNLPPDLLAQAQKANMSILKPTAAQLPILYKSYPKGSVLFPNNSDIATKFDVIIGAIQNNPDLIEFIRKIHITALNELYLYLMGIYTNLNLTNPGAPQDPTVTTANLSDYLTSEAMYATNKKKLIMNHFINLIQAQFGASIISYVPTTPPDMAVTLGKIFVHNDCGIDLTPFVTPQKDPKIIASQTVFLKALKQYIDFFTTYTRYLLQADSNGVNEFYTIASAIAENTAAMNPSMFFYDIESLRAIQFIPFVAGTIPASSQSIPWAPVVVNAAVKNSVVNGHPVAFFTDAANKKTPDKNKAAHLFLLTDIGNAITFEQELLAQPVWLNIQAGVVRVLRSCLGDFSALVGMGILDGKTENIIQYAVKGTSASTNPEPGASAAPGTQGKK